MVKNLLPGAVSLEVVRVFPQGGTPHLHTLCFEAYIPLSGRGSVQLLHPGGFQEVSLVPGHIVSFEPGVLHRLVNDQDLELLVLINDDAELKAGDVVFPFPASVMLDCKAYQQAATVSALSPSEMGDPARIEAVVASRRELALCGFFALKDALERDLEQGQLLLSSFYRCVTQLVHPHLQAWRAPWQTGGSVQQIHATQQRFDHIEQNRPELLEACCVTTLALAQPVLGMCGVRHHYERSVAMVEGSRV